MKPKGGLPVFKRSRSKTGFSSRGVVSLLLAVVVISGLIASPAVAAYLDRMGDNSVIMSGQPPVAVNDSYSTPEDTPLIILLPANGVLKNDTDPESDELTANLGADVLSGTLTLDPDGTFSYTPDSNFHGTDTFTYFANDGTSDSLDPATVTITVNSVNDPPVADPQSLSTDEDTPLPITLSGTDVDGDSLTYIVGTSPTHGGLTGTAPNLTYTPASNYHGADSFTFTVNDGTVDSAPATISITVNSVNDAPVATPQSVSTNEDTPLPITLSGTDADGDPLTYLSGTGPAHGGLTGTAPNLTYTPASNYHGADSFTFKVNDGTVDSAPATISITVDSVNDAPSGADKTITIDEDTPHAFAAADFGFTDPNDTNPANTLLAVKIASLPTAGTLKLNSSAVNTGEFIALADLPALVFTPVLNGNGTPYSTFTFQVQDNGGTTPGVDLDPSPNTITFNVTPVNDPPTPVDDNVSLPEDSIDYIISAATLTANDTDDQTPNTSLAVSLVGGTTVTTAHGSVTFKANPSPGRFEYTPVGNYSGLDSFQYRVTDGGALSANATVNLTITPLNDAPVVGNIPNQTITEGGTFATITLDNYVTDVDNLASEMTWSYSGNTALTVSIVSRVATISTPNADWNGAETITFTATDPGLLSGSDPATFTVTAVNDPPVLAAIGDKPINELAQLTFTATATDPESPPEILTFSLDSGAPAGASVTAGGDFTWTPTEADGPGVYSITVRVTDNGSPVLSDSETIQVTVAEVNAAPTLDPVGNKTIDELTLLSFAAVGHDTDVPAQTLTYSLVGAPTGTAINPATGAFTWTPTEAQGPSPTVNDYTFDVCVSDTVAVPTCETIKVTVNEVNVAPVLTAIGNKTIDELALFTYQAAATDADLPSNTLTFSLDPGAPAGAGITAGGVLTWTPTEAQGPGVYPITVRVTDSGTPALDDFETIQVTVNEINAAPTAVTDSVTILEDSGVVIITPLTNDTDPDLPLNTLSLKGIGSASKGTPSIPFGTNTISYTPGLNQNGSDTFSYTIQDNGVPPLQAEGTVNITITPVTDAPIGSAQAVTFNEDSFYTFGAGNFPLTDPSDTPENVLAGVKITTLPAKGTLTLGASAVTAGQLIPLASLPQLKFTPAANEFGTPYTTFTFQVQDNGGTADSGVDLDVTPRVFTINVTSLPDLVVGGADTYIINKSKTFPFTVAAPGVLANDTDGDGSDFTLSTTLSKDGDFGTVVLSANGSFTYTQDSPKDNYTDTFKYILHDTYPVQDVEVTVTLIIDQTPPPKTAEWVLPYPYQNAVYIGTSETVELKVVLPSLTGMDHVEFWYWDHTGNPQKYVFIGKDTTPESSGGQYYFSTLLNMNTLPIGVDFQVFARTYDAAGNYITQDLDPAYLSRLLVTHNPSKVFLPLIMR